MITEEPRSFMEYTLQCVECKRKYEITRDILYACPVCALGQKENEPLRGMLRVLLPYDELSAELDRYALQTRDLLPVSDGTLFNELCRHTPLLVSGRVCKDLDYPGLYLKDEGVNPTGTIEDRASCLIAEFALHYDVERIVASMRGHAGSSMAGVCAHTGLESILFMAENANRFEYAQSCLYGARILPVKGNEDDVYSLCMKFTEKFGGLNRNTAYNPFSIEGLKTAAIEMYLQLGNRAPDYVFIPSSDGSVVSGIYKGFYDLFQFDWIEKIPVLVAVQAEGRDALVRSIAAGEFNADEAHDNKNPGHMNCPQNAIMALMDLDKSNGFGVTVDDAHIQDAHRYLGQQAGVCTDLSGACAFAGFLASKEKIEKDATAVVLFTGSGLKELCTARYDSIRPDPLEPDIEKLSASLE